MLIGKTKTGEPITLLSSMINRHGAIFGSTGSGKSITLQSIAERCQENEIPVFLVDAKGDLTGISEAGQPKEKFLNIIKKRGFEYHPQAYETCLYDVFSEQGLPISCSVESFGSALFSSVLELNQTQTGVIEILFRVAKEYSLSLNTLDDVRYGLAYMRDNVDEIADKYGNATKPSINAILRGILSLENQNANEFFTSETSNIVEMLTSDNVISILSASKLLRSPKMYGAFLIWLLLSLYNTLPENGDAEKPKLVLFFDEAHLMFDGISKSLEKTIERTVRLIRSKGVGLFFVSQSPSDIPDNILAQLNNRIQHKLNAFTPKAQKALRIAADTLPAPSNPDLKLRDILPSLSIGQALISVLGEGGKPTATQVAYVAPPMSKIGPCSPDTLARFIPQKSEEIKEEDVKECNEGQGVHCSMFDRMLLLGKLPRIVRYVLLYFFVIYALQWLYSV